MRSVLLCVVRALKWLYSGAVSLKWLRMWGWNEHSMAERLQSVGVLYLKSSLQTLEGIPQSLFQGMCVLWWLASISAVRISW